MNQFKNGTLFVAGATVVTVIALLLTGRGESVGEQTPDVVLALTEADSKSEEIVVAEELVNEGKTQVLVEVIKLTEVVGSEKNNEDVKIEKLSEKKAPEGFFQYEGAETQKIELKSVDQPIWTQTLGDFVSLKDNEMVINVVPTNPSGLQGDNPSKVVTTKSDRFVANSTPANYNYQEMPMYNGGYYVAPMPSYLMSSVLPKVSGK